MEHFPTERKLHTDVLTDAYGPVHAEVVRHDAQIREVHIADAQGISRTYALTFFSFDRNDAELVAIDNEIQEGGLIGQTFRKYGYEIRKNVIDVVSMAIPQWLQEKFHTPEKFAKARLSEFYADKTGKPPIIYGTVVEVYTPDFRPAIVNEVDMDQVQPSTEMFAAAGVTQQEVWDRLGEGKQWDDLGERYAQAKEHSLPHVFALREKINNYMNSR
ncbi:MAG: hypothetical protein A2542_01835 [Parcubacteria group bacterium RIFOXYD2_FULL_52_8]|nr:MAG: hypothetical protein A2542_01835 [Parcubacteria group bacterium RIFOXYD2_FULL_52_8]